MSIFYEIDSTHFSFKEYWWGNPSPAVLIAWTIKLLRIRTPGSSDDPNTDSTVPFVVDQLPQDVASGFASLAFELQGLGFLDPVYHLIHDPGTRATIYWATYRHESGKYFARIHQRIWQQSQKPNRGLFAMFFTEFSDGTFLVSSSGKPDMDAPASVAMNRMPRVKCSVLWQKHLALTEKSGQQKLISPVKSQTDLIATTERHHILVRDFHLARKVFRVRTTDEQAKADRFAASVEQGRASGLQYPEIIAELDKLQEVKPAWRGAIWVLAGSVVLFFAIGAANWDWKFTFWLIPALFFHEGGHWLAMRIFKYRNLRMFFIPLFGAAVIGQNWNVPGWKKALVSLAGPLPGIALGLVLGIAGMITHKTSLIEAALILVLLNGFNLLPILPLDGGRFMQAILFCRHRWLDIGFRVLAICALAGLTFLGLGRMMIYIIIPMAITLPIAFKLAKVSDNLRAANLPPPTPGEDRIPAQTAQSIISEIKTALPTNLSNKATAQHTLNVFENLNARPPGVIATIALLILYGGGIFISVLAGMLFLVAKEGKLRDFVKAAARQPHYTFACGSVQSWQGTELDTNKSSPRNLLVTTLDNAATAKSTFTSLTTRVPQTSQLTMFGQTLLLSLPCSDDRAREQWFDRLQIVNSNTFVSISNQPVLFSLTFIAPTSTDATNIEHTLDDYFGSNPGLHLIPPWMPEAKSPRFQAYEHARSTWHQFDLELVKIWTNAEIETIDHKINAANKRGSLTEAGRLVEERQKLANELRAAAHLSLRANPGFDPQLVDLHSNLSELNYTNHTERAAVLRQVGVKLGAPTDASGDLIPDYPIASGFARRNGLLVQISWAAMNNPSAGMPALTGWLCEKGCIGIRYEFNGGYSGNFDEADDEGP